jgi:hypothetical protein
MDSTATPSREVEQRTTQTLNERRAKLMRDFDLLLSDMS